MKGLSKSRAFVLLATVLCVALLAGLAALAVGCGGAAATGPSAHTGSVLNGKTALFCGDSICAGMPNGPEEKRGWAGRIGVLYGMTETNKGRVAATVAIATDRSRGRSLDNRIISQIQAVKDNNYDYVILHGGINDGMDSIAVGTMTDSMDVAAFDNKTFAGALEELFYYSKQYFGDTAHIGYIVNYQTPMSNWGGATRDMTAYVKVARQICEKWGVSCLDLYDDHNFNEDVLKVSTKEHLLDYLHPNDSGYDLLAPKIGAWMEKMGGGAGYTLYWIIGGIALAIVVAAGVTLLVMRKRKSASTTTPTNTPEGA
jgi:lysophospholipase L1-like esterase